MIHVHMIEDLIRTCLCGCQNNNVSTYNNKYTKVLSIYVTMLESADDICI